MHTLFLNTMNLEIFTNKWNTYMLRRAYMYSLIN